MSASNGLEEQWEPRAPPNWRREDGRGNFVLRGMTLASLLQRSSNLNRVKFLANDRKLMSAWLAETKHTKRSLKSVLDVSVRRNHPLNDLMHKMCIHHDQLQDQQFYTFVAKMQSAMIRIIDKVVGQNLAGEHTDANGLVELRYEQGVREARVHKDWSGNDYTKIPLSNSGEDGKGSNSVGDNLGGSGRDRPTRTPKTQRGIRDRVEELTSQYSQAQIADPIHPARRQRFEVQVEDEAAVRKLQWEAEEAEEAGRRRQQQQENTPWIHHRERTQSLYGGNPSAPRTLPSSSFQPPTTHPEASSVPAFRAYQPSAPPVAGPSAPTVPLGSQSGMTNSAQVGSPQTRQALASLTSSEKEALNKANKAVKAALYDHAMLRLYQVDQNISRLKHAMENIIFNGSMEHFYGPEILIGNMIMDRDQAFFHRDGRATFEKDIENGRRAWASAQSKAAKNVLSHIAMDSFEVCGIGHGLYMAPDVPIHHEQVT
ncbi:uncharacterized protein PpBr36_11077 [Pyricularia pennisetigena]|uniref:uncharacterized protein n=1 Tax=Pyricularia pennisetigena TaxID=1578925 RepID=UPI001151B0EF|nr:uncharacterized protein PpBr36_11077 [Pyricularia pennisetigena]TLS20615.1 hypothetical protein PpBr36_11077 [Pyricularia pennisetigena]